ncbi:methylisocitrate lyase ICL2 NDAI_0C06140 [Naumovozyma dairenensis CBS 421]|uniref:Isocitrate lyase n=1 Tax=Naumovozyma dairenensis (strain ATCC 10597 / BCRC 20456 / CBS 421 / NBRC 0211 / NRRL Y-12639) TaxID=1071378 RepID=G0W912_NAUDC|nr:hypothetical protein NDAI_0C06140 [Naumovozyma dairenensis CBS 421]CCD24273.1 hypothetical protein NDAI_0C06140 [Naumovozyma dairenensis CBS 421]
MLKDLISRETKFIEQWWRSPRFANIERPYTALDVFKHRGSIPRSQIKYPSSVQAKKLFKLLENHFERKKPLHTLGVIDPVQMTQLSRSKEMKVVYLSGWACSSTLVSPSNDVSPDFGDYPYTTVPNQVERIFKAQEFHDKKAFLKVVENESNAEDMVDYMKPIIADGDMGGSPHMVMKLSKLFAEKGAAAIHLEDQLLGGKRCGHLSGAVLVPTGDHLSRLIACRFQWDLLGTENLLIARTDSCNAKLLSSSCDPRDHEFIKGISHRLNKQDSIGKDPRAWNEILVDAVSRKLDNDSMGQLEEQWYHDNELLTFDETVERLFSNEDFQRYLRTKSMMMEQELKRPYLSLKEMEMIANKICPTINIGFDWDAPRTKEGYYIFKGCMEAAIRRSLVFSPYSDMIWLETKTPDLKQAQMFSEEIHSVYPHIKLVYNLSPSFNWSNHGYTPETLKTFIWDLAQEGFILQLVSLAGLHSDGLAFWELVKSFENNGMQGYVSTVQEREREIGSDVLTHQRWSGAEYIDSVMQVIQNGSSSQTLSTSGDAFTETQF